jgi:hypothetical protein
LILGILPWVPATAADERGASQAAVFDVLEAPDWRAARGEATIAVACDTAELRCNLNVPRRFTNQAE